MHPGRLAFSKYKLLKCKDERNTNYQGNHPNNKYFSVDKVWPRLGAEPFKSFMNYGNVVEPKNGKSVSECLSTMKYSLSKNTNIPQIPIPCTSAEAFTYFNSIKTTQHVKQIVKALICTIRILVVLKTTNIKYADRIMY